MTTEQPQDKNRPVGDGEQGKGQSRQKGQSQVDPQKQGKGVKGEEQHGQKSAGGKKKN